MTIQYPGKLSKNRKVYFAIDNIYGGTGSPTSADRVIQNRIYNKLVNAGLNVVSSAMGPGTLYANMKKVYDDGETNAIIFNVANGVDPANIREVAVNGNDNRGRTTRARGNDAVIGWMWNACDFTRPGGTCYNSVRDSETKTGRLYNPLQYCKDNKIYVLNCSGDSGNHPERADYTGEKIAQAFIDLFEDGATPEDTPEPSTNEEPDENDIKPTTDSTKTISTRTITKTYSIANYEKVIRAKTDLNGAFKLIPLLPYKGEYNATIKFAGDKTHDSTTKTVKIYNYSDKSSIFKETLLQTKIITKYTDGTVVPTQSGTIPDNKHCKRVITTETYNNGKKTKTETRTIYVDTIIQEKEDEDINNNNTPQVTEDPEPSITTVDDKERYSPFQKVVNPVNGVPDVNRMHARGKKFVHVDTTRKYRLSRNQFLATYSRDSKMLQVHSYKLPKYNAFESMDTDTFNVIERQYWNSVVESVHRWMVKHTGAPWPSEIVIDFPRRRTYIKSEYKVGGVRQSEYITWRNTDTGKTTIWFCGDDQDWGRDCGPTSLSVCTQVLMKYVTEKNYSNQGPSQLRDQFNRYGFKAETFSGKSTALNELDEGRPCIWHIWDHYIALCITSNTNNNILVANSAGSNTYTYNQKLNTGWHPRSNLDGSATGAHVKVRLNWTLDADYETQLKNFYKSMGGAWERPFADESIYRVYYGSVSQEVPE